MVSKRFDQARDRCTALLIMIVFQVQVTAAIYPCPNTLLIVFDPLLDESGIRGLVRAAIFRSKHPFAIRTT